MKWTVKHVDGDGVTLQEETVFTNGPATVYDLIDRAGIERCPIPGGRITVHREHMEDAACSS